VILEIRVPRFFVVMGRPVVQEIQRTLVGGLDPTRIGRDWLSQGSVQGRCNPEPALAPA
jgi:hypothetical protein